MMGSSHHIPSTCLYIYGATHDMYTYDRVYCMCRDRLSILRGGSFDYSRCGSLILRSHLSTGVLYHAGLHVSAMENYRLIELMCYRLYMLLIRAVRPESHALNDSETNKTKKKLVHSTNPTIDPEGKFRLSGEARTPCFSIDLVRDKAAPWNEEV